ncbi:hypothetical protein GU926_08310 [Nibribacter ruber]|uniref:Uncharacterized protein n=1 Tax=Nibribacter ruber TaxID=2698458 RepID=A0A6P1NYY2_9BACT|nr:hypothetical protein [Nibribacter ruber]QHL87439.1 hypothetical protein GU926_08310 [Nibribacter ruber]
MNQERTKAGQKMVETSLTKAVVYFKDGNSRKFYSRDLARNSAIPDMNLGYGRLRKMVEKWGASVAKALIYDNRTEEELDRFEDGAWN